MLASSRGETLDPVTLHLGAGSVRVSGPAPAAPGSNPVKQLNVVPGAYRLHLDGLELTPTITVTRNQVEPILLAVEGGHVRAGGVYAGAENVNLGLGELGGKLVPLAGFEL
ncbi:MAG: hypothetical protein M3024_01970, partial [Candidatus Dormibacteraeota bacterium]|nr:hypothetical protein [Candidatus Dormibacteraeota bacterium]